MHLAAVIPNATDLIETVGTVGLLLIVYAESGLLLGLVFPGDSLLIIAGTLAAQGKLNIWTVVIGTFVAAVLGTETGYWLGQRFGPALFRRPDSRLFKHQYVERSREFFERHGAKTIVLARFMPFVRTLVPMLAGIGAMPRRRFTAFNVLGAAIWAFGFTLIGYTVGKSFAGKDKYVIAAVLVLSVIPIAIHVVRERRRATPAAPVDADAEAAELKRLLRDSGE
jgi:membrane-associated protein